MEKYYATIMGECDTNQTNKKYKDKIWATMWKIKAPQPKIRDQHTHSDMTLLKSPQKNLCVMKYH